LLGELRLKMKENAGKVNWVIGELGKLVIERAHTHTIPNQPLANYPFTQLLDYPIP